MSQVAEIPKAAETASARLQVGETIIKGRCVGVRKAGQVFLHLIVLPAPDPFTSPATVEVSAKARHASAEDDVQLRCRVTGYRRSYENRDKQTGEITTIYTADNRLQVVE